MPDGLSIVPSKKARPALKCVLGRRRFADREYVLSGSVSPPAVNSADHAVGYHSGFYSDLVVPNVPSYRVVEIGFPGDSQSVPEGAVGARAPTVTITPDHANLMAASTRSRPRGMSRAFLSTFIRFSRQSREPRNSSFLGQDRMDKLMKV